MPLPTDLRVAGVAVDPAYWHAVPIAGAWLVRAAAESETKLTMQFHMVMLQYRNQLLQQRNAQLGRYCVWLRGEHRDGSLGQTDFALEPSHCNSTRV